MNNEQNTSQNRLTGKFSFLVMLILSWLFLASTTASAVEPIEVGRDDIALELTKLVQIYSRTQGAFQVSTAPGIDGIVRRIEVRAKSEQHQGDWAVFALANVSDVQLDRLIVAPHFRLVNSGLFWPDLGADRITSITPSEGFSLQRQPSDDADIFLITLDPGTVITFVAEMAVPELAQLNIWEPQAYKDTVNSFTLYRGIVLGISGLLAVFLTILFVVRGTSILPAAAVLAWAVLAYVSVDFGFFGKLITVSTKELAVWRAGAEVSLAASIVVFLFTYLNLNRWHTNLAYGTIAWISVLCLLYGVAIYDPAVAAGIARFSFALTAIVGIVLIAYLGFNKFDRAILLIPTWSLILAWLFGAWLTVSGQLANDVIQPALGGGLVLIVLLIGFTVMQHTFTGGNYQQGLFSDLERQSLAITGAGDIVWDWDVSRDRIITTPCISSQLGIPRSAMQGPARNWLPRLHPHDRDHFRTTLDIVLEHRQGSLNHEFRLRAEDGHYHWYLLRARPVVGSNGEVIRCVGTLIDMTAQKNAEERLLHDAVHDSLTGLANRRLFIDRLDALISQASSDNSIQPVVFMIDIDRFKQVNIELGMSAGDTILLTLARRLKRLLKPQDTLARIAGDQFGLILLSEHAPDAVAALADTILEAIMVPINISNREVILTASVGLVTWVDEKCSSQQLIKDAELAMYQAKRLGGNRIEPFRPAFVENGTDRLQLESDLRRALERDEIYIVYQPIVRLDTTEIAGFEALMRWEHPRRGNISPTEFIPIAESSDLIFELGLFVFEKAMTDLVAWQKETGNIPIYTSINISSAQFLKSDLYNDLRSILSRTDARAKQVKLELTETIVMQNPEQSIWILDKLRKLGFSLAIDDFGTGYSSLSYLTKFPFDTLKIDRSLIANPTQKSNILLTSIVTLAQELNMSVIAEGVSNDREVAFLRGLGCEFGQSFAFGHPVSAENVRNLLIEQFPLTK